jgi:hypothetical protein
MPISSKVDIVNMALTLIGGKPILSFDDISKEGALARTTYDGIRDVVLESHPWKCAIKRAAFGLSATEPGFGYSTGWDVPQDCLRVIEVEGTNPDLPWVREGNLLLCDIDAPCNVRYIFRNETVGTYSPSFIKALAQRLQAEWAEPITRNSTVQKSQFDLADRQSLTAKANSGQEQSAPILGADHWIDSR